MSTRGLTFGWHFELPVDRLLACPDGCGRGQRLGDFNPLLLQLAEVVRYDVGWPLLVLSGRRCSLHNDDLKGSSPNSLHMSGDALDIARPGALSQIDFYVAVDHVVQAVTYGRGGVGQYDWGLHFDTGRNRQPGRRWDLRTRP